MYPFILLSDSCLAGMYYPITNIYHLFDLGAKLKFNQPE